MISLRTIQEVPEQLPEVDLPGGVAPFLHAFFSVPQWIQMAGGILAALVALGVLVRVVRERRALLEWFRARPRALQAALAALGLVLVVLVSTGGVVSWNYMQHDNDFCTGCHVMGPAYQRFTESAHAELSCHDCHRQSIFASARQLHLWIRDRPEEIGEHSPVPTEICAECHINEDPADNWPQIAATAGHLVHLESDSSALADVQCVTCHGQEVHRFRPADQTCGQAGCHAEDETRIALGAMTGEAGLHCVACHDFTAERAALTVVDSATGPLTPGLAQCTSCHEMEELFAQYDPLLDPHDARCGACHNPHEQETPELALRSCTDAGCHARPDTISTFHVGLGETIESECTTCHLPHVWVRDGDDCLSCHQEVLARASAPPTAVRLAEADRLRERALPARPPDRVQAPRETGDGLRVPGPSDPTLTASLGASRPVPDAVATSGAEAAAMSGTAPLSHAATQEAFGHREHRSVPCTDCHSNRLRHGEILVRTQSDCFACHHSTRTASAQGCGRCHGASELGRVRRVSTRIDLDVWDAPRLRALPFDHDEHATMRCVDCHGGGARQRVQTVCANCHQDHHPANADTRCLACHEQHREDAHTARVHTEGCTGSGCHLQPGYSRMQRTRDFCAVCHQDMTEHEVGAPCVDCHLVPADGSAGEPR